MSMKMTVKSCIDLFRYKSIMRRRKNKPIVSVICSAKARRGTLLFQKGIYLGRLFGLSDFTVIQGGGPGLMSAVAEGVKGSGKGEAIGLTIPIRTERAASEYNHTIIPLKYFFTRKVCLYRDCDAIVALPGGFGTLDELFEAITLMQTEKISIKPIILYGRDFWEPIMNSIKEVCVNKENTITLEDMEKYFIITDCVNDIIRRVQKHVSIK